MHRGLGFNITTDAQFRKDAYLFGEAQSRIVVTVNPSQKAAFEAAVSADGIACRLLGEVGGNHITIDGVDFGQIAQYQSLYDNAISKAIEG
jgi:phosphoribosylformylglycinamidine synthase